MVVLMLLEDWRGTEVELEPMRPPPTCLVVVDPWGKRVVVAPFALTWILGCLKEVGDVM